MVSLYARAMVATYHSLGLSGKSPIGHWTTWRGGELRSSQGPSARPFGKPAESGG
jgi:hypothetical protein